MKGSFYKLWSLLIVILVGCSKINTDGSSSSYYSAADPAGSSSRGGGSGNSGSGGGGQPQPGVITAGEWNDLDNWGFWKSILQKDTFGKIQDDWGFYTTQRISVNVTSPDNKPQIDVPVQLTKNGVVLYRSKTDNKGNAELYPSLFSSTAAGGYNSFQLNINNGTKIINDIKKYEDGVNKVVLPAAGISKNNVDISFVIDATGSMGDELEYLKTELYDVINRVKNMNTRYSLSTSSIVYRDEGDEYLTRVSPFTRNISSTIEFIKAQSAAGGGDFPEAVHCGLDKAINELQWPANARTRIIFLVLDAPPHNTNEIISKMHSLIRAASEKGIKIIPVTASGINKDTEFLMRFLSVSTNGTYVFITNDSGVGDTHLIATVGEYEVEFLNDLMVRVINKYIE